MLFPSNKLVSYVPNSKLKVYNDSSNDNGNNRVKWRGMPFGFSTSISFRPPPLFCRMKSFLPAFVNIRTSWRFVWKLYLLWCSCKGCLALMTSIPSEISSSGISRICLKSWTNGLHSCSVCWITSRISWRTVLVTWFYIGSFFCVIKFSTCIFELLCMFVVLKHFYFSGQLLKFQPFSSISAILRHVSISCIFSLNYNDCCHIWHIIEIYFNVM